jgi:hypothetical protein
MEVLWIAIRLPLYSESRMKPYVVPCAACMKRGRQCWTFRPVRSCLSWCRPHPKWLCAGRSNNVVQLVPNKKYAGAKKRR